MKENLETTLDASFCGIAADPSIKCKLHQARAKKCMAFEGIETGMRFYGCAAHVISPCILV